MAHLIREVIATEAYQRGNPDAVKLAERAAKVVAHYDDKPAGGNDKPAAMYIPFTKGIKR